MNIYEEMLETWCEALLGLQVTEIKTDGIYGGIMCPSCSRIHGRTMDAVYPFMYMAHKKGDARYMDAAIRIFDWAEHVARPDGSWVGETNHDWKGITVFSVIQLAETLKYHGAILERSTYDRWKSKLRRASEYLFQDMTMATGNINYPITCSAAMTLAGEALGEEKYRKKAYEFAHNALAYFTPNGLIFGEGSPQNGITPKGCRAVDLGYNVEESLTGLTLYALLSKDLEVERRVAESLKQHLEFMLPDGAWDNSWGTRSFKWTYWGSRTSDGCQAAYALMSRHDPAFAKAAYRNAQLLKSCTKDGYLYGGPHYHDHGELPCIHHTLFHAKAFATVLDYGAAQESRIAARLPRERRYGVREYPEIDTLLVSTGGWRATVTGYDWEYAPASHASGGALSMLWHENCGCLLAASLTEYAMIEENNMQLPMTDDHACITPRIELVCGGKLYRSISDTQSKISHRTDGEIVHIEVNGNLVDTAHRHPEDGMAAFTVKYTLSPEQIDISAAVKREGSTGKLQYILPVISQSREDVRRINERCVSFKKGGGRVAVESSGALEWCGKRIFNLIPGFEAVPLCGDVTSGAELKFTVRVTQ